MPVADNMPEYQFAAPLFHLPSIHAHSTRGLQTLFELCAKVPHGAWG